MSSESETIKEHQPRKRRRLVISCTQCHQRKKKCDRGLPCNNCVKRGSPDECIYEHQARKPSDNEEISNIDAAWQRRSPSTNVRKGLSIDPRFTGDGDMFGYSSVNEHSSLAILKRIDVSDATPLSSGLHIDSLGRDSVRKQYQSLVRRLPPRPYCKNLVELFFDAVNWNYYTLEKSVFYKLLEEWWANAYQILSSTGTGSVNEDLQGFPGLLFQVLALALQFLPPAYDPFLEDLKQGTGQSFCDLSEEYSDCGVSIIALLSRNKASLVSIQAEFLRASWLKNTGRITASWHSLGQAIKHAQELGFHQESTPSNPTASPEMLVQLWTTELHKRIWINLYTWDAHIAMILGRPMSISLSDVTMTPPIDCPYPDPSVLATTIPFVQSASAPPTPLTERLLQYNISLRVPEVRKLEADSPLPKDPSKITQLHSWALNFQASLPPTHRLENPDTRWDQQCTFLPPQRELLEVVIQSFILSVHRPFIFSLPSSREKAFEAALAVLDSQARMFKLLDVQHYKLYSLSFYTFDAAIIMAAMVLSNPTAHRDHIGRAQKALRDGRERLEVLSGRYHLAQSCAGILKALEPLLQKVRLPKANVGRTTHTTISQQHDMSPPGNPTIDTSESSAGGDTTVPTPASTASTYNSTASAYNSSTSAQLASTDTSLSASNDIPIDPASFSGPNWQSELNLDGFDFDALMQVPTDDAQYFENTLKDTSLWELFNFQGDGSLAAQA